MAIYFNLFWQVGLFPTLSFVPILIKRLSPIKEISKAEKPLNLFLNRIFFDNDNSLFRLNITKIYRKQPRFFRPITEPSKIGWRAAKTGAKYGAKIAAKPIEPVKKIIKSGINIFLPSEKVVLEIDQQDCVTSGAGGNHRCGRSIQNIDDLLGRKLVGGLRKKRCCEECEECKHEKAFHTTSLIVR